MASGTGPSRLDLENSKCSNLSQEPQEAIALSPILIFHENEKSNSEVRGWTPLVVVGGITCCFGSALPAGFNMDVMNNPAHIMQNFCNNSIHKRYGMVLAPSSLTNLWAAIVSIFLIGGITGSLIASWFSDKFGRRGALGIGNAFGIIGAILFASVPASNSVEVLMLGRLIVGLSGGVATSVLPTYMAEIAPLDKRGAVGVLCQLGVSVGIFLGQVAGLNNVLGTKDTWHIMLASFAPLCIISFVLLRFLPESPKYLLIIKGQEDRAIQELRRLRNVDVALLNNEIRDLQEEAALHTKMNTWTVGRVLKDPSVRLPLMLVCSLQLGQQLSGINAVFYYSNIIFEKAKMGVTGSQYATLSTGLINIAMAVLSVKLMSQFPRRTLFLNSCYLNIGCLIVLCISLLIIDTTVVMPSLCTIAVFVYVLSFGIGLAAIPYFIGSELFEVGPRPAAMSLGSVCNWGSNFMVGMLFPPLENSLGPWVFLFFVIPMIFITLFARRYLPETRGVDTAHTASKLMHGFSSR